MTAPMFRAQAVRVRVPASSANLGPGFDAFALALRCATTVVAQVTDEPGLPSRSQAKARARSALDEKNLVVTALRTGFSRLGGQPRGLTVVCANRIPHGRGLGSSAAAIVSGLVAARWLTVGGDDRLDDDELLDARGLARGSRRQRRGGAPAAASPWRGTTQAAYARGQLPVVPEILPVAFLPHDAWSTSKARRLLPPDVPHADAAFNAGPGRPARARADPRSRPCSRRTEDRLHQQLPCAGHATNRNAAGQAARRRRAGRRLRRRAYRARPGPFGPARAGARPGPGGWEAQL